MQCPTCKKLGLPPSYFCTQDCFKTNWGKHKAVHSEPPKCTISTMSDVDLVTFNFLGTLRPGKITPRRPVPSHIARPDYADNPEGRSKCEEADRGNKMQKWAGKELDKIKKVCQLCREVLDIACAAAKPGMTTDEIDRIVHEATIARNMYPSPLNYYNFPKSVCTSINEIICHGIPDSRPLQEGDIVNIDVSGYLDGVHGDLNEMVFIGKPDADSVRLVHCTYECLAAAIATVAPGNLYKHCGDVIEARANKSNCSVVRTYSGHGVGDKFHTSPTIAHYANNKSPGIMAEGHVFTIEPMINLGVWQDVTWPDNWTSSTKDGKRSAQFEHTMVVVPGGVELLTNWVDGVPFYQKQLKAWGIELPTD
jgi:methionyl aminopeptidase